MIEIIQYTLPPGGAAYHSPEFFGGQRIGDALAFDSQILRATATRLVIQSDLFNGELETVITGSFIFSGDEVFGTVDTLRMSYQGNVFQHWRNLDWDVAEVSAVLDKIENGRPEAMDNFLTGFEYTFVDHKSGGFNHIMATDGDDVVTAQKPDGDHSVTVFGFGGDDTVNLGRIKTTSEVVAGAGNDTVQTGSGADQIRGEDGRDVLKGGRGSDNIDGQKGRDKVFGQGGDDNYLTGGGGNDVVKGGGGADWVTDHRGTGNKLFGQAGNDNITGRGLLDGGAGDDWISGRGQLRGGTGDDRLMGKGFKTDVFDFRLGRDAGFGNDIIESYDTDEYGKDGPGGIDEIRVDAGMEVDFTFFARKGDVVMTVSEDGTVVGTANWKNFAEGYTQADANVLIAALSNDLVFV